MPTPVAQGTFAFADGNAGHSIDLGSSPSAGQWDVLCVNSNTTVSTPSGFTLAESAVTNQGAYIFVREAAGSEGSTVTITTSGNHNTHVCWSRWDDSLTAVDTSTSTQANASAANTTPTHTTGTLAEAGELVVAFAALHAIGNGPTSPTWSSGYTQINAGNQSTGAQAVYGNVSYKENAGTAAEAPQLSWSGDAASNRYMLAVSFTVESGLDASVAATLPAMTAAAAVTQTNRATATAALPALTGAAAVTQTNHVAASATLPALTGAVSVTTPRLMAAAASLPALSGALEVTGGTPPAVEAGSWGSLRAIIESARADAQARESQPPTACPNDFEPLSVGPHGELFCRFDGWVWSG